MPITPPNVRRLVDAYSDAVNTGKTIVELVSDVAPAATGEVLCAAGGLASLGAGPFGSLQSPGTLPRTLHDFGGMLQAACSNFPAQPPGPGPAVPEPGQCPGVLYNVQWTLKRRDRITCADLTDQVGGAVLEGPIRNFRLTVEDIAFCNFGGTPFLRFVADTGPGQVETLLQSAAGNFRYPEFAIDSITRQDGLPDDCGDPVVPPAPPRPPIVQPPSSPPIPWNDDQGNPMGDVIISPRVGPIYIDVDATLKVPVVVNINGPFLDTEISIPVSVSLPDYNVSFNFGGGGGTTTDPTAPVEPTPPQPVCCDPPLPRLEEGEDEDPEDPPPEEDPPTAVIVGAVIASQPGPGESRATELGLPKPDLFVPRVATFQWELDVDGTTAYSPETQVKSLSQYISAPENVTVTRGLVGWERGWEGTISYAKRLTNPGREVQ